MLRTVRRVSIERRLPLLMSVLLLIVVAALAGSAYREVRRAALAAAHERLQSVITQLTSSNAESYRSRITTLAAAGRNDTLSRYVAAPVPAARDSALRIVARLAQDTASSIGALVTDSTGHIVLATGDTARMRRLGSSGIPRDSGTIGPLARTDSTVAFAEAVPVRRAGRTIGQLTRWSRLNTSARSREVISRFIGLGALIFIGNPSGDVWVDLAGAQATPAPRDTTAGGFIEFERPGLGLQYAAVRHMAGTPWMMEIDFPRAIVLGGMRSFFQRVGLISIGVLAIGAFLAWLASRHITQPLLDVTHAAESVAAGDLSKALTDRSADEVGRLARAFNAMREHVRATQEGLEETVSTRTGELRIAMHALEEAQEELLRKERLALLGQLSSSVGHELRNPLGVMSNAVYYLEAVLPDAPDTAKEYLGILRNQIAVSEKIVSDLLDFARVRKPERKVIGLAGLLAEQLQGHGVPPNVRLTTQVAPETPAVFADPVHMGQIVRNLASNAYQAMEASGGTLTVRAAPDGPGNVRIDVTDTGTGIAPDLIDKIFEPLFTTKARGIGLGLPVSRTLATANGGALTASNNPGGGATFTLILPAPEGAS
jgi:signal transduction histidine kinase